MRSLVCSSGVGVLLLACSPSQCSPPPEPTTEDGAEASDPVLVFQNVRVFDGEAILEGRRVEIAGGTIRAVSAAGPAPEGAEVIDGEGMTLLPGFIDAHTHAFAGVHLRQALMYGVTTELDMLNLPEVIRELKAHAAGNSEAADLFSAGNGVTAPGGHGTQFMPGLDTFDGDTSAEAFIARRVDEGSDFIKLVYDDLRAWGATLPTLSREQLEGAVAASRERELVAVVHVSDAQAARASAEAGAHGLVHLWVDEPASELADRLAERQVFVVPTLSVLTAHCDDAVGAELAVDEALAPFLAPGDAESLTATSELTPSLGCEEIVRGVGDLVRAGVVILAGSDAPNPGTAHGVSMHGELDLLVRAGLSPVEALRAATSAPADAFGLEGRGRIAAGKRADLVLVEGDPAEDIRATRRIVGVWKGGVRLDREAIVEELRSARGAGAEAIAAGEVSDFEDGVPSSRFGAGWIAADDSVMGGASRAAVEVIEGGARGTQQALRISGEVAEGPIAFAGANFLPGADFTSPADLSAHEGFSLFARGDGGTYTVIVYTPGNFRDPPWVTFEAGEDWEEHEFSFADFADLAPDQIAAFFIGATIPGEFSFEIDEVRLSGAAADEAP
jgi:imidazolonepropionase-like amidohydrolase